MLAPYPTDKAASRRAAVANGTSFALFSCALGVYVPFFPVWLDHRGYDAATIGVLLSIAMAVRVVASAPIVRFGDGSLGTRRLFLLLSSGAALAYATFFFIGGLWLIGLMMAIAAVMTSPAMPLLDVIVMQGVARHGHDYGRVRLWGSIGWLSSNLFAGVLLTQLPTEAVPAVIAAVFALAVFAGFFLDHGSASQVRVEDAAPVEKATRGFVVLLAGIAILQGSHSFLMGFSSLMWKSMGYSEAVIGWFWSIGTVAEIALFFIAGRLGRRFSALALIVVGAIGGVVRWIGLGFGPSEVPVILLFQVMHVFSFALIHIGTMVWLGGYLSGRARRQGIVASALAAVTAVTTIASGYLYTHIGAAGFFVMAAMNVVGLALVIVARRELDRVNAGSGSETASSAHVGDS